jgi:hypothetical protein
MSSALLVEERYKSILTPSALVSLGFLVIFREEFKSWERFDAIFLSQRLIGNSIGVYVRDDALHNKSKVSTSSAMLDRG